MRNEGDFNQESHEKEHVQRANAFVQCLNERFEECPSGLSVIAVNDTERLSRLDSPSEFLDQSIPEEKSICERFVNFLEDSNTNKMIESSVLNRVCVSIQREDFSIPLSFQTMVDYFSLIKEITDTAEEMGGEIDTKPFELLLDMGNTEEIPGEEALWQEVWVKFNKEQ